MPRSTPLDAPTVHNSKRLLLPHKPSIKVNEASSQAITDSRGLLIAPRLSRFTETARGNLVGEFCYGCSVDSDLNCGFFMIQTNGAATRSKTAIIRKPSR